MAEVHQDDWSKYSVKKQSEITAKNRNERVPLVRVSHVTRVFNALTILRDGQANPKLIYDESRLNTERILVVWLSPNYWNPGFRYGNISFDIDWTSFTEGYKYYWVGVMDYSTDACRILITKKDRSGQLKEYDPHVGDGPWIITKAGKHYWNGKYTLEFMLEEPFPLHKIEKLTFVKHHPKGCSISPMTCEDCGHSPQTGAARFLAGACDRKILDKQRGLWLNDDSKPNDALTLAWDALYHVLTNPAKSKWSGTLSSSSTQAKALARAAMGTVCDLNNPDRTELLSLFESAQSAIQSCASLIEEDLSLEAGSLPRG